MDKRTQWVGTRLNPKEKKKVEREAEKHGRSVSNYIRFLLRNILK